jgi:large subunit ribosomal protein L15
VNTMPHDLRRTRKYRGSRYCGWGQVGQHRKSGSRGGKGFAGGHKHFWIQTVKYNPNRYRRIGFVPPSSLELKPATINVGDLEALAVKILGVEAAKSGAELDLGEVGIGKLLGKGSISTSFKVRVESASAGAKSKLEEAGGSIVE